MDLRKLPLSSGRTYGEGLNSDWEWHSTLPVIVPTSGDGVGYDDEVLEMAVLTDAYCSIDHGSVEIDAPCFLGVDSMEGWHGFHSGIPFGGVGYEIRKQDGKFLMRCEGDVMDFDLEEMRRIVGAAMEANL